jgi:non-lysosomal glucosylceramidase
VQHPIVSPEFVLVTWRNYVLWKDDKYLDEMYPRCQAALRFAMTLDKDKDGVVNEDPGSETGFPANQYYDIWPWWGTSAYTGSIWLAALRAGEEMAKKKGDAAFADEMRKWYQTGSNSFYQKLWTGSFYRLYNDPERNRVSDTCLTNGLCGQWFAYVTGLGDIVPRATILSTVDTVFRRNVPATKYGAVNGVRPDGAPDETFPDHSAVITIGEVWNFCAMAAFAGRKEDAMRLFIDSYANILLQQRTPWNIPWCLDRNTGSIKWGINYYSNPCVWTLFQALDPDTYAKLAVPPK